MVNIIEFLGMNIIFLIISLIVLIGIIIVLFIIQRNLKKKVIFKEEVEEKKSTLLKEIENLKASRDSSESILSNLNSLTKDFLLEEFGISKNSDYEEIIDFLEQKNKLKVASFCKNISEALYSGEKIGMGELNSLIDNLYDIVSETHPMQKTEIMLESKPILQDAFAPTEKHLPSLTKPLVKKIQAKKELSIKEKLSLPKDISKSHVKMDEKQIADMYNYLQKLYNEVYRAAEKRNDFEDIKKLEEFRDIIIEKNNKYMNKYINLAEFADIITNGVQILIRIKYGQ